MKEAIVVDSSSTVTIGGQPAATATESVFRHGAAGSCVGPLAVETEA